MQAAARGLIARRGIEFVFEMHEYEWAAVTIQAAARGYLVPLRHVLAALHRRVKAEAEWLTVAEAAARIQAAARRRAAWRRAEHVLLTITEAAGGVLLELHDINKAFPAAAGPTEESTPSFRQTRHAGREGTGLISTDGPGAQGASAEEMEAAARAAAVAAAVAARQRALTLIQGVARGRIVRGPLAADPRAARSVDVSRHVPGADGGG